MVSTQTPTQAYIPLLLGFIENRLVRHLPPGQRSDSEPVGARGRTLVLFLYISKSPMLKSW